jgi:UDP-sugar pyrophosphorylase
VNSLAVPRYAKQAVGAITKLVYTGSEEDAGVLTTVANALTFSSSGKKEMTVNVEYNQLDPLLRATVSPEGDVNDPITGGWVS